MCVCCVCMVVGAAKETLESNKNYPTKKVAVAVAFDELMLVTGAAAGLVDGWPRVVLAAVSHAAIVPLLFYLFKGLSE